MADVFLSYSRQDQAFAEQVASALATQGWTVFFDSALVPGDVWDERIEGELAGASAVVVLWSSASRERPWVRNEAREGLQRSILCPALIDNCTPPVEFSHIQSADLRGREPTACPGWSQLLKAISDKAPRRLEAKRENPKDLSTEEPTEAATHSAPASASRLVLPMVALWVTAAVAVALVSISSPPQARSQTKALDQPTEVPSVRYVPTPRPIVEQWAGTVRWPTGEVEVVRFYFGHNGTLVDADGERIEGSWRRSGERLEATSSLFSLNGETNLAGVCGTLVFSDEPDTAGQLALRREDLRERQGNLPECPASAPAGAPRASPTPTRSQPLIPTTCQGQNLTYQQDMVVIEIRRDGSIFTYVAVAVEHARSPTRSYLARPHLAYQDLGLSVGDTFCSYQGRNRARIAGDNAD